MIRKKLGKKYSTAKRIIKNEGAVALSIKTLQKLDKKNPTKQKNKIGFLVKNKDVLDANWTVLKDYTSKPVNKKSYSFNWVMSPPGKGSGGHQNLFRFMRYLELAGHKCNIYLYSNIDVRTVSEIKSQIQGSYPKIKAKMQWLDGEMEKADGIFATGWETAYPVFNSALKCKKFYFVQDFEPSFYPMGSEYVLAENTYKFGFYGVTAGGWLAQKLRNEYGMRTDFFDFGADNKLYRFDNNKERKEIFFYARPVTSRRGFELGIMTLELFHKKHPDYTINLAGWDVSDYEIPFPYKNLKTLELKDLPKLYNRCAAALVMSLTNMSLLPLELLSCGAIPVVNEGNNNRLVSNNEFIQYVPNTPPAMAARLSEVIEMQDLPDFAKKAAQSVKTNNWDDSGKKFVSIIERELRNG